MGFKGDSKHPTSDAIQAGLAIPSFAVPSGGRNIRSVWEIATEPFSGRALFDDEGRIPSPDCPMHVGRGHLSTKAVGDEHAGARLIRTRRIEIHPEQGQLDGSVPTDQSLEPVMSHDSSDSMGLGSSQIATSHNTQSRKMASRSDERGTASEETPDHTEDTLPEYESSALSGSDSPEASEIDDHIPCTSGLTGGAYSPPGQSAHGNARGLEKACTCQYIDHFATFPQALVEPCIKAGCPPHGVCLDPFIGSGTTALVARRLGRKCIGVELSPEYAELAAKRLSQLSLLA
jgi:DNA methylase